MSCLGRAAVPVKRVWRGLSARLGLRRTTGELSTYVPMDRGSDDRSDAEDDMDVGVLAGLGRLRKEVRTCEYRDVHVMWEMLSKSNTTGGTTRGGGDMPDDDAAGKGAAATRRTRRGRRLVVSPTAARSELS
ncbi:uncharacterized protein LOC133890033 isoform X1 [Phragmites australis]|uniref:uncharacterized protein LOC133890033 isoform X1 n=1 Tax=Phragmites australis TaxID=29695 RepID=UPI002D79E0AF|nr:uncharacterized protein LOC133890033 isoform X1 [Phragmites australis]